ncbi:MAG: glycosyltransferase family 39 protein [Myxococcota bacterium]
MAEPGNDSTAVGGSRRWRLLPATAAVAFALLTAHAACIETPTIDEFAHLPAGLAYLEHGALGLYAKNPPLFKMAMALGAAGVPDLGVPPPVGIAHFAQGWGPWNYAANFMDANREHYFTIFFRARLVVIATSLALAALIFAWTRELFGERSASITTALVLLSPTLLAHGHLATLDVACAAGILASLYALRWAMRDAPTGNLVWVLSQWRVAIAGAVFGVALLVKFTALLLAPALLGLLIWKRRTSPGRAAGEVALLFAVAVGVVNLGMGGRGSLAPLGDQSFRSEFARQVQSLLPEWTPMPLPRDYVLGFDAVKRDSEQGELGSYLFGRWTQRGVWYHDIVAFAVKTPLPLLAMLAVCPFALRRCLLSGRLARGELPWLLAPLVTLGFGLIFVNQVKIGVRYLLPLEPLLWLVTASFPVGRGEATCCGASFVAPFAMGTSSA